MFPFANRRTNYSVIEDDEESSGDALVGPGAALGPFPGAGSFQAGAASTSSHPPPPPLMDTAEELEDDEEAQMTGGGVPPSSHEVLNVSFEGQTHGKAKRSHSTEMEILGSSTKRDHRWDHIEDVDQFFTLIYEYHQGNGFACIALRHAFALFQFLAVVVFSTFLLQCVDYGVLFNNKNVTTSGLPLTRKRTIQDAIIPSCPSTFPLLLTLALALASLFWLGHLVRVGYRLLQLIEMRTFFSEVLQIPDAQLSDIGWADVVQKLCQVQPAVQLIINQETLSPLDVYQRILRFKNFFVALVYKDILPPQISVPCVGSVRYLSSGLRLNLEWLLFWGPWAPWRGSYALKDEYREAENLEALAVQLRRSIAWMGLINLALFPFIFLYQVLFSFFSYADMVKREPGVFGTRKYSSYGREKLRHFNELDHELNGRLNRSYEFAVRYMEQFISPTCEIVAKTVAFTCGSVFAVLLVLSAWDEDVLGVEHVLTVMTLAGAAVVACRSFIPDEHIVLCQQFLMRHIVAHIHYAPASWLRDAASSDTYREFALLFHLKAQFLAEELLSPLVTPYALFFCVRPRAEEIVRFFHSHTRFVDGVGDVCTLALMDITRDGDCRLASVNQSLLAAAEGQHALQQSDKRPLNAQHASESQCGKVELSLLNFAAMNPSWTPPQASASFIATIRERAAAETPLAGADPLLEGATLRDLERSMRPLAQAQLAARQEADSALTNPQQAGDEPPPSFSAAAVEGSQLQQLQGSSHAGSFIHPLPLAQLQPRRIAERNARAMEMSRNTLALSRLLADNSSAMGASALFGGSRPTAPGAGSRYGTLAAAGSNIWGVPSTSVLLSEEQNRDSVFFRDYTRDNL